MQWRRKHLWDKSTNMRGGRFVVLEGHTTTKCCVLHRFCGPWSLTDSFPLQTQLYTPWPIPTMHPHSFSLSLSLSYTHTLIPCSFVIVDVTFFFVSFFSPIPSHHPTIHLFRPISFTHFRFCFVFLPPTFLDCRFCCLLWVLVSALPISFPLSCPSPAPVFFIYRLHGLCMSSCRQQVNYKTSKTIEIRGGWDVFFLFCCIPSQP